jgi:hypothetical protein
MAHQSQYQEMGDTSLIAERPPSLRLKSSGRRLSPPEKLRTKQPDTDEKGPEYTTVFWAFEKGESAGKPGSVPLAR